MESQKFATERTKLLREYAALGKDFLVTTKPYKSTLPVVFDVVTAFAAQNIAFAVARKGQQLDFFGYGIGDNIADGLGGTRKSTEADTNVSKAKSTNGAEDFVIEGFSFGAKGVRVANLALSTAVTNAAGLAIPPISVDPDVTAALLGQLYIGADTLAVVAPPQVLSSLNLEQSMLQALISSLSLELQWDETRTEKISTADIVPEGGARSYLRANGAPEASNRYRVPEGYVWRRDGEPDSDFIARMVLRDTIVVPLLVPTSPFNEAPRFPTAIVLDVSLRAHGCGMRMPSRN